MAMKEMLERLIRDFYIKTGGTNPTVIIVKPETWDEIIEEVAMMYPRNTMKIVDDPLLQDNGGANGFWYKGIRVYRSEDIDDGLMKVY